MATNEEFVAVVKRKFQDFEKQYNAKNFEGMNLHADDCLYLPPGVAPERGDKGKKLISDMFMSLGLARVEITPQDVCGPYNGEIGLCWNTFKFYGDDGGIKMTGKSMMKWKNYSGDWKVEWEMLNSDTPMGPPK